MYLTAKLGYVDKCRLDKSQETSGFCILRLIRLNVSGVTPIRNAISFNDNEFILKSTVSISFLYLTSAESQRKANKRSSL